MVVNVVVVFIENLISIDTEKQKLWWIPDTWCESKSCWWHWFNRKAWKMTVRFTHRRAWGWHVQTGRPHRSSYLRAVNLIRSKNFKIHAAASTSWQQAGVPIIIKSFPSQWNLKSINMRYFSKRARSQSFAPHHTSISTVELFYAALRYARLRFVLVSAHAGTRKVSWSALAMIAYEFLINIKVMSEGKKARAWLRQPS